MFNKNNKAWKCSCRAVMPRLTVLKCTKCGKCKELGESLLKKKGDRICPTCSCNNFAERSASYRCGEKRVQKRAADTENDRPPVARSPNRRDC
jgi:predicted  nucleic acid-binding Zn-ribbon protein